jgi:1-acyl-sn-glycerol-3-phosphate acyltransferase
LFYSLVKIWVRLALRIFCTNTTVTGRESLAIAGPLLLVSNHPNSFLDAIVIGAQFSRPVHFLARGDAFHKPWHNTLLRMLNMIPVYRLSEGKENLHLNESAFQRSREVLEAGGIVLIFIEGICLNTHQLQTFKKGAARIAWESRGLPGFLIIPMGIAFDHFRRFGKELNLHFGKPLLPQNLLPYEEESRSLLFFNQTLYEKIRQKIRVPVSFRLSGEARFFYTPIACIGWLIHAPLYYPLRNLVQRKTRGTIFYDSVLFGVLLFAYPLYLLLLSYLLVWMGLPFSVAGLLFVLLPLSAWITVRWRKSFYPEAR